MSITQTRAEALVPLRSAEYESVTGAKMNAYPDGIRPIVIIQPRGEMLSKIAYRTFGDVGL